MLIVQILLAVFGLSSGFSFSSLPQHGHGYAPPEDYYQPRALHHYQPNDLNRPIIYPQLGMSPAYHNLVYKYIMDFAGNEQPPHVNVDGFNQYDLESSAAESHATNNEKETSVAAEAVEKPGVKENLQPSDFILLGKDPHSQVFGNLDAVKTRKMNYKDNRMANPPLGGVMSNYVLLRTRPDFQNFIPFSDSSDGQVSKRQISDSSDADDTVVINAENPHNVKMNEDGEESRDQGMGENGEEEEEQPAIAQSKPAAIALAGPGGVAQASPVGTALVGPGGLAVAAPSGTAVAGPAGKGVISPTADDKTKIVQKKIKEAWN